MRVDVILVPLRLRLFGGSKIKREHPRTRAPSPPLNSADHYAPAATPRTRRAPPARPCRHRLLRHQLQRWLRQRPLPPPPPREAQAHRVPAPAAPPPGLLLPPPPPPAFAPSRRRMARAKGEAEGARGGRHAARPLSGLGRQARRPRGGLARVGPGPGARHLGGGVGAGEEEEEDERAPEARGAVARDRVLRARVAFQRSGVLGRPPEDGRRPEISADFPALIDFVSLFDFLRMHLPETASEL